MRQTIYRVDAMDCPCEEQLIRMKLAGIEGIHLMQFDLEKREVTLYHEIEEGRITTALDTLRLGSHLLSSTESTTIPNTMVPHEAACSCSCVEGNETKEKTERRALWFVLIINFGCFLLESITGYIGESMGLLADGMDMLADSVVYTLALLAVGTSAQRQRRVAGIAGGIQLILALWGIYEVTMRVIHFSGIPSMWLMIGISLIALTGNTVSLLILNHSNRKGAHMEASRIFTSADILVNIGVIASAVCVTLTHSPYPDLIIGILIFLLVLRSAWRIFRLAC